MVNGTIDTTAVTDIGNRLTTLAGNFPPMQCQVFSGSQSADVDSSAEQTADDLRNALTLAANLIKNKGAFAVSSAQRFASADDAVRKLMQ